MLQACPNGSRLPGVHPALPITPAQIAAACARAVAAGAVDLHVHPKDDNGHDTLSPPIVDAVVGAVRQAVPGVPIGVTSGAWSRGLPLAARLLARLDVIDRPVLLHGQGSATWPGIGRVSGDPYGMRLRDVQFGGP